MKKQGISITGTIVFIGLIAVIVWGLNYIITKDFVVLRTPISATSNKVKEVKPTVVVQTATSTETAQKTQPVATSTTKTPEPKPSPIVTTPKTPTPPASSDLTITLTDKGFSPDKLTVKKGQTVTFVNNSSGKMWVAANPFPTSSEYPDFNQKTGVENGSSWNFVFDKTGTWFYHNHFNLTQGAKIVVNAI